MSKQAAPKEAIKPELLPADLGGGQIQFIKRSDYARRTAETWSLKTKAEIKKDHVTQVLDALDKGQREISGDENPEPLVKLWDAVRADYDDAIKEVEKTQAAEKAKKEEEERLAKEAAEKEAALLKSAVEAPLDLSALTSKFDTGSMDRFIPKGEVSNEELVGALKAGLKMAEFSGWMRGDLVVELEKRGQLGVVKKLAEQTGVPYSNIYNDARTARRFPPETRKSDISFTVYREVGSAKWTAEQEKAALPALVNEVAEGKHNSQSVREAVKKAQGKETPATVAPEDDPKHKFIVIDPGLDLDQVVTIATGFPRDLVGGGVIIINPKTNKRFTSLAKKGENRWEELGEYKPAASEEEQANNAATPAAKPAKKKAASKK